MPVEYERQYTNMTKHYSRYHGYAYDGVWAAALAIEEVGRKAHAYNLSLADFSYRYLLLHGAYLLSCDDVLLLIHTHSFPFFRLRLVAAVSNLVDR